MKYKENPAENDKMHVQFVLIHQPYFSLYYSVSLYYLIVTPPLSHYSSLNVFPMSYQ